MAITKEELKKLIDANVALEKDSSISSDGRTLLTRIPKDIVKELKLKKGNKLRWFVSNKKKKVTLTIEK